ncbi:hypothetical protein HON52_03960 [Candidatus Uhrbacteria bacterium]|jgi:hypothetical protein|nr:hypothetical protein [Candidatus Uhrbacteria bacterium]
MDNLFLGELLQTIGELALAYTVLRVHHGVMTEKHIDKKVILSMKSEQFIGMMGVILIIIGFLIRWI